MKVHLISYGDEKYASQKLFFKETAITSSFFDEITVYGPEIIDYVFQAQFLTILKYPRGGGYWVWKPYLIKRVLSELPEGDILIYCDSGCMINIRGSVLMASYIDLLLACDTGSVAFELPHLEIEYTKKEVFEYFNTASNIVNSAQLIGGVIMLRKCHHSTFLIDRWYNTFIENPLLFADDKNLNIQYKQFLKHKHDQSIFSVIRKTYGTEIIPDQTYYRDFIREGLDYPIWATRLR